MSPSKTKPGRPPIPADQKKKPNPTLQVRLTEEQKQAYRERMGREVFISILSALKGDPINDFLDEAGGINSTLPYAFNLGGGKVELDGEFTAEQLISLAVYMMEQRPNE